MKANKRMLPGIILLSAVFLMAVYGIVTNIAKKPTTATHEFPFSITYELDGKVETFEGIYVASYVGNGGYVKATTRRYEGSFISERTDADTSLILRDDKDGTVYLRTLFYPDYLMGDTEYDYFSDMPFAPILTYSNYETGDHDDAEILLQQGARLISWDYPEPIENSFVFSHIAHMSGEVVLPFTLIAALAFLAILIFVKKDPTLTKRPMDKVSFVLNLLLALLYVPFMTIVGIMSDINGSSGGFAHQLMYLGSSVTLLSLGASVALRRRGFSKESLLVQIIGPAMLGLVFLLEQFA